MNKPEEQKPETLNSEVLEQVAGGQEVIVYDKDGKSTYTCSDGVVMAKCH